MRISTSVFFTRCMHAGVIVYTSLYAPMYMYTASPYIGPFHVDTLGLQKSDLLNEGVLISGVKERKQQTNVSLANAKLS